MFLNSSYEGNLFNAIIKTIFIKTLDKDDKPLSLYKKLNIIQTNKSLSDKYIKRHLKQDLFEKIDNWRLNRNNIIHGLVKMTNTKEEIAGISLEGYEIVKKVNTKSTLVNKYLDNRSTKWKNIH